MLKKTARQMNDANVITDYSERMKDIKLVLIMAWFNSSYTEAKSKLSTLEQATLWPLWNYAKTANGTEKLAPYFGKLTFVTTMHTATALLMESP